MCHRKIIAAQFSRVIFTCRIEGKQVVIVPSKFVLCIIPYISSYTNYRGLVSYATSLKARFSLKHSQALISTIYVRNRPVVLKFLLGPFYMIISEGTSRH